MSSKRQYLYRKVKAKQGAMWLTQAYHLFKSSFGTWIGVSAFLMIMSLFPVINMLIAILMPIAIGGLMIGCQQLSKTSPLKFDHLFEGLKSDSRQLLVLSLIYAFSSLLIIIATYYLMLLIGVDYIELLEQLKNKNILLMTETEQLEWQNNLIQSGALLHLWLGILIILALMLPLFMAYWFAPALVVLQKASAINSLRLSFKACKDNFAAFFIYGLVAFGYLILFVLFLTILAMIFPLLAIPVMLIGYLAIFAITLASIYTSYVDIFDQNNHHSKENIEENNSDSSMLA